MILDWIRFFFVGEEVNVFLLGGEDIEASDGNKKMHRIKVTYLGNSAKWLLYFSGGNALCSVVRF